MKSAVDLLKEAVSIPSITPEQTHAPELGGERRMADWLGEQLGCLGFEVAREEVEPGRPNLVGRFGPQEGGEITLFESHLDTVGVDGMKHDPFCGELREGRLYGRGASDCKGAMAAALHALAQTDLRALARRGHGLVYLGTMGEETGNHGARAWCAAHPQRIRRSIVLEPTELEVVHAHKGICWFGITLHGRSAHGSNPDVGVNAILAASACIQGLQAMMAREAERRKHPVLGRPSLNIGVIHAGIAPNVVPASCEVKLDWRMAPPTSTEEATELIRGVVEPLKQQGLCLDYEIECLHDTPSMLTDADSDLVRRMIQSLASAGVASKASAAAWCSDAALFAGISDQTITFGPGSIKQAHASTEYIEVSELETGARALADFLQRL